MANKQIDMAGDRVLILPDRPADQSAGGVVLPPTAQGEVKTGVVVAVGEGRTLPSGAVAPLEVQAGDRVYYKTPHKLVMEVEGVQHLIMEEEDIVGVAV